MAMVPKIELVFQTRKNEHPSYLFDIISKVLSTRTARNDDTSLYLMLNMNTSEIFFFQFTVIEWTKLDNNIRNSESVSTFKKQIL